MKKTKKWSLKFRYAVQNGNLVLHQYHCGNSNYDPTEALKKMQDELDFFPLKEWGGTASLAIKLPENKEQEKILINKIEKCLNAELVPEEYEVYYSDFKDKDLIYVCGHKHKTYEDAEKCKLVNEDKIPMSEVTDTGFTARALRIRPIS